MLSQYLRTKERDGVVAIFHELHPDPVYCPKGQWEEFINGTAVDCKSLINELIQRKLIIHDPEEDSQEFDLTAGVLERKLNQPTILYLMTAQGCNFECKYCPVPETARKYGASLLSSEDAFAGIQLWQEHLKDNYDPNLEYFVIFYGGEPLLNKETIKQSLVLLKEKRLALELPSKLNFMITTNGLLMDDETIEMCKEFCVSVVVGLDGPTSESNSSRVDIEGQDTFAKTVETIERLVKSGVKTFASSSITPDNLEYLAKYSSFFKKLGVEKFGFNLLKGTKLVSLVGIDGVDEYYRKASRGILENARKQDEPGFEYQMEKKQVAFDNQDFFPVDCTCYGNQLVIQPDGQVSNCPFYKANLGQVRSLPKNFRIWDQAIVKEWRQRLPLYHAGEAKGISGGGCAWSSIELYQSPIVADKASEIFSEEVLNELIWTRYQGLSKTKT